MENVCKKNSDVLILNCVCVCVCQVGLVSVALCAPTLEGTYTSHWRLAHGGEQFGPRVWCSIVVDPEAPTAISADGLLVSPCVTPQVSTLVCHEKKIADFLSVSLKLLRRTFISEKEWRVPKLS